MVGAVANLLVSLVQTVKRRGNAVPLGTTTKTAATAVTAVTEVIVIAAMINVVNSLRNQEAEAAALTKGATVPHHRHLLLSVCPQHDQPAAVGQQPAMRI